jgi:hypothetical protein
MPASWLAVVNLLEPNSPEKQKPAEGRALHPVETGETVLWQDQLPRHRIRQSSGEFPLTGKVCA